MVKYYVWKDNDRMMDFFDYEDAFQYAMEYDCDEIEKTVWDSEEDYQNYEPATEFETVWRKENN